MNSLNVILSSNLRVCDGVDASKSNYCNDDIIRSKNVIFERLSNFQFPACTTLFITHSWIHNVLSLNMCRKINVKKLKTV